MTKNKPVLTKVQFPPGLLNTMDTLIAFEKQYTNRTNFITEACREKIKNDKKYNKFLLNLKSASREQTEGVV